MTLASMLLALIVGTWNGNWFPSGRAEHRAPPEEESKTIQTAAVMLRNGLEILDPTHTEEVVLCLNEMRGPQVVSNLVSQIGWPKLAPIIVTGYRRRDRYDQQQDAIVSTLCPLEKHWSVYKRTRECWPPRGYVFAAFNCVTDSNSTLRVYCTHLKSEYGATDETIRLSNRGKRSYAIEQLLAIEKPPRKKGVVVPPVVIAGDFNADFSKPYFKNETIFAALEQAGFLNPLATIPAAERDTNPSNRWGPNTIDYIVTRSLPAPKRVYVAPLSSASDHRAVFYLY